MSTQEEKMDLDGNISKTEEQENAVCSIDNKVSDRDDNDDKDMNDMMDVHFPVFGDIDEEEEEEEEEEHQYHQRQNESEDGKKDKNITDIGCGDNGDEDYPQVKPLVSRDHNRKIGRGGSLCMWDDNAVLRCFALAVRSHDRDASNGGLEDFEPKVPTASNESVSGADSTVNPGGKEDENTKNHAEARKRIDWSPGEVPLPIWAIDPLYES